MPRAPHSLAVCSAVEDPPPPTPMTSTSWPGPPLPWVTTMRHAVMLVRTKDAASSYFTWAGSDSTLSARTATSSASAPRTCSPSMPYRTQRLSSPAAQNSQRSHVRFGFTTTRSPTFTPCAAAPTSTTSPAISQPVQKGSGVFSVGMPSRTNRSRWTGCDIAAGPEGQRRLQRGNAFADEQVEVVQRARLHPDEDLVRRDRGIRNVLVPERVGTAELVEEERVHREPLNS